MIAIYEAEALQRVRTCICLNGPMRAAIIGIKQQAFVAGDPTFVRVNEFHVEQIRIDIGFLR